MREALRLGITEAAHPHGWFLYIENEEQFKII